MGEEVLKLPVERLVSFVSDHGHSDWRCAPTHEVRRTIQEAAENDVGSNAMDFYEFIQQFGQPRYERRKSRYIPKEVREHVMERDGGRCVACGSTDDIEFDHRKPHSGGGSNTKWNIQLLCAPCNADKGDRNMSDWGGP